MTINTMDQHPLADTIPALKIADRCDSQCGAQAFVAVLMTASNEEPLRFCGHHYAQYEAALKKAAPFAIRDERDRINHKSESSA